MTTRETTFAPEDGQVHGRWVDHGDEGSVVVREQYVGDIRDWCLAAHNEGRHGRSEMKHVARIPNIVIEHYLNVHQVTMQDFMRNPEHLRRMLNDPALADFRIAPGKV